VEKLNFFLVRPVRAGSEPGRGTTFIIELPCQWGGEKT